MSGAIEPVTISHPIEGFHCRSMMGTEEISQPFHYEIELLHADGTITAEKMLGTAMTIHLVVAEGSIRHFNGYVTDFSLRGIIGENALYAVTLRPWLSLLAHRTNCRIFKGTALEIVKLVFDDHADVAQVTSGMMLDSYPTYEFVVQYRESDLNFVMRTLERDGIYFYFTHKDGQHSMVLTDSDQLKMPDYPSLVYHPPDIHAEGFQEQLDDWRSFHTIKSGKLVTTDYNFEAPLAKLETNATSPGKHASGDQEAFEFPGGYVAVDVGTRIARRRLEALQVPRGRFEGTGNVRGLSAGQAFTLEQHPTEAFNKEYLVYSANFHIFSHAMESGGRGGGGGGDMVRSSLVAYDASLPFRPAQRTPKPIMSGIQTAKIVGGKNREIETDPKGYGRVKVKFPWDRDPDEFGANSCWVRVSQTWAGANFGAVFHPRIGQEVLVDFLEGDPDRPIIIGRVYNNKNMPAYTLPVNETQSGIRSHSTLEGGLNNFNEIRFEDKKGSEELFIQAEKVQTTKVKGSQSISVGGSRSVTSTGKETYTVNNERKVTVDLKVVEEYKNTHDLTVTEKQTIKAKSQDVTAPEGITLTQEANTSATLKGKVFTISGGTTVKLLVGATSIEISKSAITITSAGTVEVKGATINLNASG